MYPSRSFLEVPLQMCLLVPNITLQASSNRSTTSDANISPKTVCLLDLGCCRIGDLGAVERRVGYDLRRCFRCPSSIFEHEIGVEEGKLVPGLQGMKPVLKYK